MSNEEMMQAVLEQLANISGRLDSLEAGQKRLEGGLNEVRRDIVDLRDGQTAIRRDITRLDRKIDTLSLDVGNALANVTDNVGDEIERLKRAK